MPNPAQTQPSEQELAEVSALFEEYGYDYHVGLLYLDTNRRWCLWEIDERGNLLDWEFQVEFNSGKTADIMLGGTWLHGSFEHGAGSYYFTIEGTIITPHQGLRVRVKRRFW